MQILQEGLGKMQTTFKNLEEKTNCNVCFADGQSPRFSPGHGAVAQGLAPAGQSATPKDLGALDCTEGTPTPPDFADMGCTTCPQLPAGHQYLQA